MLGKKFFKLITTIVYWIYFIIVSGKIESFKKSKKMHSGWKNIWFIIKPGVKTIWCLLGKFARLKQTVEKVFFCNNVSRFYKIKCVLLKQILKTRLCRGSIQIMSVFRGRVYFQFAGFLNKNIPKPSLNFPVHTKNSNPLSKNFKIRPWTRYFSWIGRMVEYQII